MVRAIAARTIFNEALEPLPQSRNRQMRLSQKPVLADSLIIEVEKGGFAMTAEPEVNVAASPTTSRRRAEENEDEAMAAGRRPRRLRA